MSLADGEVQRVRAASDIVAIIGEFTNLKRSGTRYTGLCPFHSEKSPSFSVNQTDGLYYCFGCSASGDIITFVREIMGLDFMAAMEYLATRANITLNYVDSGNVRRNPQVNKVDLVKVLGGAVDLYHSFLLSDQTAGVAKKYLSDRGYDDEIIKRFKIGYSPNQRDFLVKKLKLTKEIAEATGLGYVNEHGYLQDSFRDRVMFPIFDVSSRPVAFGGRILDSTREKMPQLAKYKNSKETALYIKKKVLYGLNWAKQEIVQKDFVIICEGYTDVLGFHISGLTNAVASCGTAFGEDHIKVLSSFTKNFILAFDSDNAGLSAASKVYEWESKYHLIIKVAEFPQGTDPAQLAAQDKTKLADAVSNAKPYLKFRIDRLYENTDMNLPEVANRVSRSVLELIAEHPESFVRDRYLVELSDFARIDINLLRSELKKLLSVKASVSKSSQNVSNQELPNVGVDKVKYTFELTSKNRLQYELLKIIIQQPEKMVDYFNIRMFADPVLRVIVEAMIRNDSIDEAKNSLDEFERNLVNKMNVEEVQVQAEDAIARLLVMQLKHLLILTESSIKNSNGDLKDLLYKSQVYSKTINQLNQDHVSKQVLSQAIKVAYND